MFLILPLLSILSDVQAIVFILSPTWFLPSSLKRLRKPPSLLIGELVRIFKTPVSTDTNLAIHS